MEKDRSSKVIAIVALLVAVVGLSIGFAAFSKDLNITFSESNANISGTLDVKFIASNDKEDTNTTVNASLNNASAATPATIVDGDTITGLGATFTGKNQSVSYDFYVYNYSEYDAYLKNVDFLNYGDSNKNIVCTALEGTNQDLVDESCADISVTIDIAGETAVSSNLTSFTTPKITAGDVAPVKVTISYNESATKVPNGDFKINVGGIKLSYSSLIG